MLLLHFYQRIAKVLSLSETILLLFLFNINNKKYKDINIYTFKKQNKIKLYRLYS